MRQVTEWWGRQAQGGAHVTMFPSHFTAAIQIMNSKFSPPHKNQIRSVCHRAHELSALTHISSENKPVGLVPPGQAGDISGMWSPIKQIPIMI